MVFVYSSLFFFFKQKTAYEMRISDWSSDVCSSDPKSFDRQRVCTAAMDSAALEAARRETDAGSTRTVASLCRGERTLGIAEGSPGGRVEAGGDSFARFVGLLGREALPRQNPVYDDDCVVRFCD